MTFQPPSKSLTPRDYQFIALVTILFLAVSAALVYVNLTLTNGGDFYVNWVASRGFIFERIDPYSGEELVAFPAIHCDVVVIHALEGDARGNVKLNNNLGVDMELIYLAETVIVTVENIVERVERTADSFLMPAPATTHLVHAPRGAYPTSCYPLYPIGGGEFMRYVDACNAGKFEEYIADVTRDN